MGPPQLPQPPLGTPQAPTLLEEEVNARWHCPALSLLWNSSALLSSSFLLTGWVTDSEGRAANKSCCWRLWHIVFPPVLSSLDIPVDRLELFHFTSIQECGQGQLREQFGYLQQQQTSEKEEITAENCLIQQRLQLPVCSSLVEETNWVSLSSLPCSGLSGTSDEGLRNIPPQFFCILRHRDLARSSACISFLFAPRPDLRMSSFSTIQNLMEFMQTRQALYRGKSIGWLATFVSLSKKFGTDGFGFCFTAHRVSHVWATQGTMSKDSRLARKGAPSGFGHCRRHSCLGYVHNTWTLHLVLPFLQVNLTNMYNNSMSVNEWMNEWMKRFLCHTT